MYFEGFDLLGFWEESDYAQETYTEASPTDALIAEIEAELGYRLPGAYIALMRSRNGGIPRNTAFPTKFPTTWAALWALGGKSSIPSAAAWAASL